MSVNRTDYLMFGVKLDPRVVDHDRDQAMIEGQPDAPFDLIYDGMSGEYAVAGKVIARSDPYEGMVFTEITDELLPKDTEALSGAITSQLELAELPKMKLYLFSHYS